MAIRDIADPQLIRIDHTISFGFALGPGKAGAVMDAMVNILEGFGIVAKKWVDNYLFLNSPIANTALALHPELYRTRRTYMLPLISAITPHSSLAESQESIPKLFASGGTIPKGHTTITFTLFTFPYCLNDINKITAPLKFP